MLKCFPSQAPFKDIYEMIEATSLQVTQSKKGRKKGMGVRNCLHMATTELRFAATSECKQISNKVRVKLSL